MFSFIVFQFGSVLFLFACSLCLFVSMQQPQQLLFLCCCVVLFLRSLMDNAAAKQMISVSVRRSGVDVSIYTQQALKWMSWMKLCKIPAKPRSGREGVPFIFTLSFQNLVLSFDSNRASIYCIFFSIILGRILDFGQSRQEGSQRLLSEVIYPFSKSYILFEDTYPFCES